MSNHFDTMRAALIEARQVSAAADSHAHELAALLCGRLRRVGNHETLRVLKSELRAYNPHTRSWRAPK